MEKYVLFMDETGEIIKRDIVPMLHSSNPADEIGALVEQYGKVIQSLENIFENLMMSFHKCNVMMEENKAQNHQALLPEYDTCILTIKMNADSIIDSIRIVKEGLMKHCCLLNDLIERVKETEQISKKPFPEIEKIKESKEILQRYIAKCDKYIGMITVFNNELTRGKDL